MQFWMFFLDSAIDFMTDKQLLPDYKHPTRSNHHAEVYHLTVNFALQFAIFKQLVLSHGWQGSTATFPCLLCFCDPMLQIKIKRPKRRNTLLVDSVKAELHHQKHSPYLQRMPILTTLENIQIPSPLNRPQKDDKSAEKYNKEKAKIVFKRLKTENTTRQKSILQKDRWKSIESQFYEDIRQQYQSLKERKKKDECNSHRTQRQSQPSVFIKDFSIDKHSTREKHNILHSQPTKMLKLIKGAPSRLENSLFIEKGSKISNLFLNNIEREESEKRPVSISVNLPKIRSYTTPCEDYSPLDKETANVNVEMSKSRYRQEYTSKARLDLSSRNVSPSQQHSVKLERIQEVSPWMGNFNTTNDIFYQ